MFAGLADEFVRLTKKLEAVGDEIGVWIDDAKLKDFAKDIAERFGLDTGDVLGLFKSVRPGTVQRLKLRRVELMDAAVNVGVKKEHAERYLRDVQCDFPRMVAYK